MALCKYAYCDVKTAAADGGCDSSSAESSDAPATAALLHTARPAFGTMRGASVGAQASGMEWQVGSAKGRGSSALDTDVKVEGLGSSVLDTDESVEGRCSSALDTDVSVERRCSSALETDVSVEGRCSSALDTDVSVEGRCSSALETDMSVEGRGSWLPHEAASSPDVGS